MSITSVLPVRPRITRRRDDGHVYLVPTGDGWSLVNRDGRTVVRGAGQSGRRRCLEYASAHGILAVLPWVAA